MPKRDKRTRMWACTIYPHRVYVPDSKYAEKLDDWLLNKLETGPLSLPSKITVTYMFGALEICPKTEVYHCHYLIYFLNPVRRKTLVKYFKSYNHYEPCEDFLAFINYIQKSPEAGPWTIGTKPLIGTDKAQGVWTQVLQLLKDGRTIPEIELLYPWIAEHETGTHNLMMSLALTQPNPFADPAYKMNPVQTHVMAISSGLPMKKRIIWVWSSERDTGKTDLANGLIAARHFLPLSPEQRWIDMLESINPLVHKGLIFDLPERTTLDQVVGLLPTLERFANHTTHCLAKWRGRPMYLAVHVVVCTNYAPPYNDKHFMQHCYDLETSAFVYRK